jgi:MoaA/NifB/PqqE/SkfB family radical SAM enzyme
MSTKNLSYLSANTFPIKIFLNKDLVDSVLDSGKIMPIHLQLIPTNRCNFKCDFCSCANKIEGEQLTFLQYKKIMTKAAKAGCRAVTITGGGEPLVHPEIGEMIEDMNSRGIEIGLTTNGSMIKRLTAKQLNMFTWIRISAGDSMEKNLKRVGRTLEQHLGDIAAAAEKAPKVDWAFSYVYMAKPKYEMMEKFIKFANKYKFAHVRITPDILDLENVPDIEKVEKTLKRRGVNDKIVVYQARQSFEHGSKDCLISLLKPLVGADGLLYPCCGTQYAKKKALRDNDKSMALGRAEDIDKIFAGQIPFNGSKCVKCYYDQYNKLLKSVLDGVQHKKFV